MALDLHIAGPGLDVSRRLAPGDPALVLGRDADCSVCLPDPERNVSRRHLSVWNEGDALHFHVLSAVNGVELAGAELAPGARGVLPPGEPLVLSAFLLTVAPVVEAADAAEAEAEAEALEEADSDPWTQFEREASALASAASQDPTVGPRAEEDDPFGDWGLFGDTFGPGATGGALQADALAPATDLGPFAAGLGLDAARLAGLSRGELETIGRLTRIALLGLLQAQQAGAGARRDLHADDRTLGEARGVNPLRMETTPEAGLQYLLAGRAGAAGAMPPDRAVLDLVNELLAHQQAMGEAVPQALQAVLEEFDPQALKARLLRGGPRLFEAARAWEAYARDYAEQGRQPGARVRQWMERHFAEAYARALVRLKRDTGVRRP